MTQVSSRTGKASFGAGHSKHSIIGKMGSLGILPAHQTRKETVLWSKLGFDNERPSGHRNGFDPRGVNILVSDPLIEMYHCNGNAKAKNQRIV